MKTKFKLENYKTKFVASEIVLHCTNITINNTNTNTNITINININII